MKRVLLEQLFFGINFRTAFSLICVLDLSDESPLLLDSHVINLVQTWLYVWALSKVMEQKVRNKIGKETWNLIKNFFFHLSAIRWNSFTTVWIY